MPVAKVNATYFSMEDPHSTIFLYKVNVFSAVLMEMSYMVFFAV